MGKLSTGPTGLLMLAFGVMAGWRVPTTSRVGVLVGIAALALACTTPPNPEPTSHPAPPTQTTVQLPAKVAPAPAKPRLVVLLVVDQLPSWSFSAQSQYLTGGIARLLREGVYYPQAEYPYANTFTAPGHAALSTGAPPAVTGILANSWYRRDQGRVASAVADPRYPLLQLDGARIGKRAGASPAMLRVTGTGDWLRAQTGDKGRAVAISLKDRAANFSAGKRPNLAIWYDARQAAMTTSSYFAARPPDWLSKLARTHPVSAHFNHVWRPRSIELMRKATGINDAAPGEGGIYGLGNTFPHRLARATPPARAIVATPIGPRVTTETAIAALHGEKLGADDIPDLLTITFSSHDYAGHAWGQESWERFDVLLEIDRQVGVLLDELDRHVGKDRYAVVLTSDHGVTRVVEQRKQLNPRAVRVTTNMLMRPLEAAARRVLGAGKFVANGSASTVYLTGGFYKHEPARRERALAAMIAALRKVKGVGYAGRTSRLHGNCNDRRGVEALICRSIDPKGSGEIVVTVGPDSIFSGSYRAGTTHGSPNLDDRRVPLVIRAPGTAARVSTERVSMLRVAPTIARLLGVTPAATATGKPLL